jgi:phosphoenolpyruvate synthase/pyruvate phosphate dikinase
VTPPRVIAFGTGPGDSRELGGKAAALHYLAWLGYRVPPGFTVGCSSFPVATERLPRDLEREIELHLERMQGALFAVRSSSLLEDGSDNSFAGQHDTFLNVAASDVVRAVRDCWMSSQTDRAAAYRVHRGIETLDAMAVAVQIMVPAEVAGVCFTRHPANPDRANTCLVEAVWGLGEGLVSGEFSPDRYEIDRTTGTFEEHVMPQGTMWAATPGAAGGIAARHVPVHQQSARKMSAWQLGELLQLALDLEALYEHPCDIEFAIAGEVLYLLQCRPITGVRDRAAG